MSIKLDPVSASCFTSAGNSNLSTRQSSENMPYILLNNSQRDKSFEHQNTAVSPIQAMDRLANWLSSFGHRILRIRRQVRWATLGYRCIRSFICQQSAWLIDSYRSAYVSASMTSDTTSVLLMHYQCLPSNTHNVWTTGHIALQCSALHEIGFIYIRGPKRPQTYLPLRYMWFESKFSVLLSARCQDLCFFSGAICRIYNYLCTLNIRQPMRTRFVDAYACSVCYNKDEGSPQSVQCASCSPNDTA